MTFLRATIYGALLIAILIGGLYLVPFAIENNGVISGAGSQYVINIGTSEIVQFSTLGSSRLSGSLVSSSSISMYVLNETQFGLLQQFVYPQAYVYALGNSDSFSIDARLPTSGVYYLVFYSITYASSQPTPIRIEVTSALILHPS